MYAYVQLQAEKDLCFWDSGRIIETGAKFEAVAPERLDLQILLLLLV